MLDKITFLTPATGDPRFLEICKEELQLQVPGAEHMIVQGKEWKEAWVELWNNCPTDIGIFIDDDCFLIDDPMPVIERVVSGEFDMAAVEELVPYYKGGYIRYKPGYFQSSFMVVNIGKCKREGIDYEVDLEQVHKTPGEHKEFHYGLSQRLRGRILPIESSLANRYAMATYYGDFAIHLWYGSWRKRNVTEEDHTLLEARDREVLMDYGKIPVDEG